jgi:MYXO-CTERM domain-containing protein
MRYFLLLIWSAVAVHSLAAEPLYQSFTWGYSSYIHPPTEYQNPTGSGLITPSQNSQWNLTGDDRIKPFGPLPAGGFGLYEGIFDRAQMDITVRAFGANPEIDQAAYTFTAWYNANRYLNANVPFFTTDPNDNPFAPIEFTLLDRHFRVSLAPPHFENMESSRLVVQVTPAGLDTPEPASATLALLGLAAAGVVRYRRRAVCA